MEFLTKKHLSRRTVLRGLGVTMALPLLDAMTPAALAQAARAQGPPVGDRDGARLGRRHVFGASKHMWSPPQAAPRST